MDASPPPSFGEQLRHFRQRRAMSLRQFEKVAHHSKSLVWEWENGRKVPGHEVAASLDHLLGADGALSSAAAASIPVPAEVRVAAEITRRFAHQGPVTEEIRRRAREAGQLDVLAVRGLGILGLNDSLLRRALLARPDAMRVRVLLLDPDCDAAARRADEIRESFESFRAGIRLSVARLAEVAAANAAELDVRLYTQLPVWRIIRIDDLAWVSSFGAQWEGHESTIHEISRTPRGSFWAGYQRHFEELHAHARRVV